MNLAFVYAGQGSQYAGMGRDFYEDFAAYREVIDNLDVDFDLKKVSFEGPDEMLSKTEYTQPCMVAFAAGVNAMLAEEGISPQMAAGLSLGEYSALQAAGVFDAQTAVKLVAFRGQVMDEAVKDLPCGMTAVLGLQREKLQQVCDQASRLGVVEITNYNCPMQLVIAGEQQAVDEAARLALEAGAKRCLPLKVSGPFHTSLLAGAADKLREEFIDTDFGEMQFPVIFNVTARPLSEEETLPELLQDQVHHSVLFEDSVRYMAEQGIDTVVEIGPGKALSGFIRKTVKGIKTFSIEDCESFRKTVAALKAEGAFS
ncbi:MAG: ACP S-malonyltransferase [Firmicutes bacterium]|nr:ACP S-malonyltransferase [Bacillota bacterium]